MDNLIVGAPDRVEPITSGPKSTLYPVEATMHKYTLNKFMNNSIKLLVSRDYTNERIDVFLSNQLENLTRSFIQN